MFEAGAGAGGSYGAGIVGLEVIRVVPQVVGAGREDALQPGPFPPLDGSQAVRAAAEVCGPVVLTVQADLRPQGAEVLPQGGLEGSPVAVLASPYCQPPSLLG